MANVSVSAPFDRLTPQLWKAVYDYVDFDDYELNDLNKNIPLELYPLFTHFAQRFQHIAFNETTSPFHQCLVTSFAKGCLDTAQTAIRCNLMPHEKGIERPIVYRRGYTFFQLQGGLSVSSGGNTQRTFFLPYKFIQIAVDTQNMYCLNAEGTIQVFDYKSQILIDELDTAYKNDKILEPYRKYCSSRSLPFCSTEGFYVRGNTLTLHYPLYPEAPLLRTTETISLTDRSSTLASYESWMTDPYCKVVGSGDRRVFVFDSHAATCNRNLPTYTSLLDWRGPSHFGKQCDFNEKMGVAVGNYWEVVLFNVGNPKESRSFSLNRPDPIYNVSLYKNILWIISRPGQERLDADCIDLETAKPVGQITHIFDFKMRGFKAATLEKVIGITTKHLKPNFTLQASQASIDSNK